jgi:D-galactarolactone cycloisomerase
MKIVRADTHWIAVPFEHGGPSNTGFGGRPWANMQTLIVEIETDNGLVGHGEIFGHNGIPSALAAFEHQIKPFILGRDASAIAPLMLELQKVNHNFGRYGQTLFAISGVDIALWDIAGKAANMPLWQLLGGSAEESVPAYSSLMRFGDPDFKIMVDVNCPWNVAEAIEIGDAMSEHGVYWLEEPVWPPENFDGLAEVRNNGVCNVAAGENASTAWEFQQMMQAGAVDWAQPSVSKVGGITEFLKVCRLAEMHNVGIAAHSPYFGPGYIATMHLLAAYTGQKAPLERLFGTLEATLYPGLTEPGPDGRIRLPLGAGLGQEPSKEVIKEYRVKA